MKYRRTYPAIDRSGRSPHGERGLKSWDMGYRDIVKWGRSPHGERGLKFLSSTVRVFRHSSLSSWRAWIEIHLWRDCPIVRAVALLMESVD